MLGTFFYFEMNKFKILLILLILNSSFIYSFDVQSWNSLQYSFIDEQENSFYCGASVIQSILENYFDIKIDQSDIMSIILLRDDKLRLNGGISFLDIKYFFSNYDITLSGFKINDKNQLSIVSENFEYPFIFHVKDKATSDNANHFIIIIKVYKGYVLVLNPSFGIQIFPIEKLEKIWSGYMLVFDSDRQIVKSTLLDELIVLEEKKIFYIDNLVKRKIE